MTLPAESTFDPARAALERLLDIAGETASRQILADLVRPAVMAEFERLLVVRLARRLLEARAPTPLIRDRLTARGISERSAYRAIDAALALGPRNSASEAVFVADDEARVDATVTDTEDSQ